MKRHFTFKPERIVKEPKRWTVKPNPFFIIAMVLVYVVILAVLFWIYYSL